MAIVTVLIGFCGLTVLTAILHVLLGSWGLREQARIAARRGAALPTPSLATPEPDEDEVRHEIRMHQMLDEIAADMVRRGGKGLSR